MISDDRALLALVYLPELNPTALQSAGQIGKSSTIKSFLDDTQDDRPISNLRYKKDKGNIQFNNMVIVLTHLKLLF